MATSETSIKKTSESQKPINFSAFLRSVDTDRMTPANSSDTPLLLTEAIKPHQRAANKMDARLLQATCFLISAIWLGGAALYIQRTVGWSNVSHLLPHELGAFLAGILTPIALFWMIAAFVLRSNDVKMYADALRDEIQAMIFPSEEANRRVNNDIERLMRQTSEMSKATKVMLTSLEMARDGVRDQVNELREGSDETVMRLSALGKKLSAQTQDVLNVRQQLESTLRNVEDRTQQSGSIVDKLAQANQQLAHQAKTIDQTALNAEEATLRMTNMLRERIDQTTSSTETSTARLARVLEERIEALGSLHEETEDALRHAGNEIAKQRDDLRVEAQAIEEKAFNIASVLNKSTDKLYSFTDDTLDKAKLIETRLLGQLSSIENVLANTNNLSENIEKAANKASEQMDRSSNDAVERSSKIQMVLKEAVDRLEEKSLSTMQAFTTRITDTAEKMFGDVTNVGSRAQDVTEKMLSAITDKITSSTDKMLDEVSVASERAQTMTDDILSVVTSKFSATTDKMLGDVTLAGERTQGVTETMLSTINNKIEETTASFASIQKQVQTLAVLFDERKGDLDKAGVSARQTADALQETMKGALDKVQDTTKALQTGIASISAAVQQPFAMLESASAAADTRAKELVTLLESKATTLTSAAAQIGSHVNTLHDQLHGKGQDVALLAGKIATHLKSVNQELNNQQTTLDQRIQQSVRSLQLVGTELNTQGTRVTDISQQALNSISTINKNLSHSVLQLQNLNQVQTALTEDLVKTESRIGTLSDRFVQISGTTVEKIKSTLEDMTLLEADYHRLSDAGLQSIQRLESGYRQTAQTAQQQVEQMGAASEGLKAITADLIANTDNAVSKIVKVQEAGQGVFGVLQNMGEKANQANQDLNLVTSHITVHINTIGEAMKRAEEVTNQSIERFVQQGTTLQTKSNEVKATLAQTVDNTNNFANRLQGYLRQVRQDTEIVEKTVTQSVGRILTQGQQIDVSTTKLVDKIARASEIMSQQNKQIEGSSDDIMSRLKQAAQHMSDRAAALEKAAASAQQQAEALRSQETKLKRDTFFNSTKFVVESLHSLALDFTRLLDGELPEKTWKAYQKGDLGSFTRRLLNARDEETQQKIRYKFKEDLEFRTYAQRYLRQFEEIYDSAAGNDHADLLTTVFLTSDVGKLYQFLCTVLERDKRGSDKTQPI